MQPKKKSKKELSFLNSHAMKYGLQVTGRCPTSGIVRSVCCRFCIEFGREEKTGSKRKATERVKYFDHFRTDNYVQHLIQQHPAKWQEYQSLPTDEEKEKIFQNVEVPFVNQIDSHFELEGVIRFLINKSIVEVIIGDLLFHPDDINECTHARALSLFKLSEVADDGSDSERDIYVVTIKTSKRFSLVVGCVALGASFRMASNMVQLVRDESGLSFYSGISVELTSNYIRVVCAASLQILHELLDVVGGISLAFDSSTLHGMSYLDQSHSLSRIQAKICSEWLSNFWMHYIQVGVIFLSVRRIQGLATRLGACTPGRLIRIWCGLHQLDLVMQHVFKMALNEEFYSVLTTLIGHLRRQQTLISKMRSTCPKVADTRWISMASCSSWLTDNIVLIQQHLIEKNPSSTPTIIWWIFLFAVNALAKKAKSVFIELQGLSTLLSQQRAKLVNLIDTYCRMTQMKGPLTFEQLNAIDRSTSEVCGSFVLSHEHAHMFLDGLDLFVIQSLAVLDFPTAHQLVVAVARMFVTLADGIHKIVAERDSINQAGDELPPVLPHQLVLIDLRTFNRILSDQMPRLQKKFTAIQIHQIGKDFTELLQAYREEVAFKRLIDSCTDLITEFSVGSMTAGSGDRFPALCQFCGDLASAFPNTATVESDFSIIGWEKDDYRKSLTDFSLEGILHTKQFMALKNLRSQL
ncbi:hypothetical protein BC833DRAFT_567403 [Globomyces pollinis-pini]|nr:hypothetical protein BC833DRAFT_567403 [Globomyces pollinis-pini]